MTKRILLVTSSLFGENGQSSALAAAFKASLAGHDVELTERDVVAEALPHLSSAEMMSWMTDPAERSAEQQALAAISDEMLAEIDANDVIVLAVPLYNLGIPSQLKAWFDRILRAGKTFQYTEKGPVGLLEGKSGLILAARGGMYAGTEMDSQTPHIKHMLKLIGIADVEAIYAEGLNMGDARKQQSLQEAEQAVGHYVASHF
ncbi:FMN-dependent NADH-azoreductase [Salinicola rhizosphaerae]|uniref:FMN dependent NADH:quinone oxidoreductase n=1 Tax=Salinicola rhizosphaerae TaxID=1443141 RepID=A0ABQ3E3G7_9GAMM|nr:NAD(P)H-dependent oxidoreductase [Salinicola rhizosphaerae]GHB22093.1 FMN-dependent NADH-azoreductase [Salinicola rhizosphaerae]